MSTAGSTYVFRLVEEEPATAARALDHLHDRDGDATVIPFDGGRLELRSDDVQRAPALAYLPWRRHEGVLHLGRLRTVPVDVELLPWSNSRTELAMRPRGGRRASVGVAGDRYFRAAGRALEAVRERLET